MKYSILLLFIIIATISCKKKEVNSCDLDMCDSRRTTVLTADNWTGNMTYNNDVNMWAVDVPVPNTRDGIRTSIICTDIPDSLKTIGKMVTFSGELKESCNIPAPIYGGQEFYFVKPTSIK